MFVGDSDADIEAGNQACLYRRNAMIAWLSNTEFNVKPNFIYKSVSEFVKSLNIGVPNES